MINTPLCRRLAAVLCLALPLRIAGANAAPGDAEIKALLHERVEVARLAPGMVIGVVDSAGSRIFACGRLSDAHSPEVDGNSVFEIGSVTKVFTSLLLVEMVQRGEVKLDDPVSKFLPASVKMPTRNGRQITLLDLSTQTSGLPRLPANLRPKDSENPYADYSVEQLYAFLGDYTLARDIGSEYEYSNLGVGLLGHALALRAGKDFAALVEERICRPLGMNETRVTLSPAMQRRLALGHNDAGQPVKNWDLPTLAGAGALRSTANDMLKFVAANLGLTPSELWPAMQLMPAPRHSAGKADRDIGLGWHLEKAHGAMLVWHNGGTGGYRSFAGFDPRKKIGVVVLANSTHSVDDIGFHLLEPAYPLEQVAPKKERVAIHLPPTDLDRFIGQYELRPGAIISVRRESDHLTAQLTGQLAYEILPESANEFFLKVADAQLSFQPGGGGKIESLILHQGGLDQKAKRISDQPVPERKPVKLDPKIYDRYAGEYEVTKGMAFTVRREGDRLMARLTGQIFMELLPESETEFFYRDVDAQITFVKNKSGRVTELILHQNGQEPHALKIK